MLNMDSSSLLAGSGYESDPPLEPSLLKRVGRDAHGEVVLWQAPVTTDDSDSSSICKCLGLLFGHNNSHSFCTQLVPNRLHFKRPGDGSILT